MYEWIKLKIPPPIVAITFALPLWILADLLPDLHLQQRWLSTAATGLLATALLIDVAAIITFLLARTIIDPRYPHKSCTIVTHGIYRFTRNPMYLGLVLMLSALSLWLGFLPGLLLVAGFIAYILHFQIQPEESILEARFGEAYTDYKERVRRWI